MTSLCAGEGFRVWLINLLIGTSLGDSFA